MQSAVYTAHCTGWKAITMSAAKSTLFSDVPIRKAVLTLAIPTVISQLITVVYNMADTFFIGQLNDPLQVAAAWRSNIAGSA